MKSRIFPLSLLLFLLPVVVSAETMVGLQVNIEPGVDALVASDSRSAITAAFQASAKWSYLEESATRNRLNPVVRDCFTKDCLIKAGEQTGSKAGIRVHLSGEAQIYDWTIETFDLRSGEQMAIRKGACELCGRNEVARTFRATIDGLLQESALKTPRTTTVRTPTTEPQATTPLVTSSDTGVKIVTIEITTEPPSALIVFRDAEVGRGRALIQVGPGDHAFTITADGYRTVKEMVVVEGDATNTTLRVHLAKKEGAPQAVMVKSEGPVDQMGQSRVVFGVIGTVFGLGLIGTGMFLGAIDGEPNCKTGAFTDCPEVYDTGTAAFLTTFTGTALLTAGAVLLAWEVLAGESNSHVPTPSPKPTGVKVAPAFSSDSAGVSVFGRF